MVRHDVNSLTRKLLEAQNEDGGWSNLSKNSESDAFATGMTLYALSQLDQSEIEQPVARAREFLLRSQLANGSWNVPANRIREGDRNDSVDEVFSYWGTAWATIGLTRTLP